MAIREHNLPFYLHAHRMSLTQNNQAKNDALFDTKKDQLYHIYSWSEDKKLAVKE